MKHWEWKRQQSLSVIEDEQSIETKLTVMKNLNVGGVAAWQLGLEDKAIWDVIDAFVKS